MDQNSLIIYNASAGSGKTFKLVTQYISILLESKYSKKKFKGIASMTFTNKAALEMKERIIEYLYLLKTKSSNANHVFEEIKKNLNISKEEIATRANLAFREILHSYEDFHVSTIDKFNLKLIRSFYRDLELSGDFEVIIDEKEIHEAVVDLLLEKIGDSKNESLSKILTSYAQSNLEFGESWNFRSKLIEFCEIVTKEKNNNRIILLEKIDFSFENYNILKNQLKSMEDSIERDSKSIYEYYISLDKDVEDIPGKSTTHKEIISLKNNESMPKPKTSGSLFNQGIIKICKTENLNAKLSKTLCQKIISLHEKYIREYPTYLLLQKFRSNFFNMALLQLINNAMEQFKRNQKIIRISDLNKLIGSLVQNEEAPYIYEKIGGKLEHYLLDEFQDTSRLQWLNLIPLIHDSISNNKKNIIVGDPKQSIYRFNNGMAEQFVSLPNIYNPQNDKNLAIRSSYFENEGQKLSLNKNFRSAKNIVLFNNKLFDEIIPHLTKKAADFYKGHNQLIQSKHLGYVKVKSYPSKLDENEINNEILAYILSCQSAGHALGDMAILTENNADGNRMAKFLTENGVSVVSNESILLKNSFHVKLLVFYIYIRQSPSNVTYQKRFVELFLKSNDESHLETYLSYFDKKNSNSKNDTKRIFSFDRFIDNYFISEKDFFFPYTSIYHLSQQFIRLLKIKELDDIYIHHLLDFIYVYEKNKSSDLKSFLDFFESNKNKIALQLPDAKDSIKILTIHKSKGLEFPIVILPNLNFNIQIRNTSKELIAVEDKMIYTNLKLQSEIKEIANATEKELQSIFIDKLNLAYVALTRPKNKLFVIIPNNTKGLGALFQSALMKFKELQILNGLSLLELGENNEPTNLKKLEVEIRNYTPDEVNTDGYKPSLITPKLKSIEKNQELIYGMNFHDFVSKMNFHHSIEENFNKISKLIFLDGETIEKLAEDIKNLYQNLRLLGLLKPSNEILHESSILIDENITERPDLIFIEENKIVVVELKTGPIKNKHKDQLKKYLRTIFGLELSQHKNIIGYLYSTIEKEMNLVHV